MDTRGIVRGEFPKDDDVSLLLDAPGVPLTDDLPGLVAANLALASPALTEPILVVVGIPGVAALAPRVLHFGLHALADGFPYLRRTQKQPQMSNRFPLLDSNKRLANSG
jgi:hypothetical protein